MTDCELDLAFPLVAMSTKAVPTNSSDTPQILIASRRDTEIGSRLRREYRLLDEDNHINTTQYKFHELQSLVYEYGIPIVMLISSAICECPCQLVCQSSIHSTSRADIIFCMRLAASNHSENNARSCLTADLDPLDVLFGSLSCLAPACARHFKSVILNGMAQDVWCKLAQVQELKRQGHELNLKPMCTERCGNSVSKGDDNQDVICIPLPSRACRVAVLVVLSLVAGNSVTYCSRVLSETSNDNSWHNHLFLVARPFPSSVGPHPLSVRLLAGCGFAGGCGCGSCLRCFGSLAVSLPLAVFSPLAAGLAGSLLAALLLPGFPLGSVCPGLPGCAVVGCWLSGLFRCVFPVLAGGLWLDSLSLCDHLAYTPLKNVIDSLGTDTRRVWKSLPALGQKFLDHRSSCRVHDENHDLNSATCLETVNTCTLLWPEVGVSRKTGMSNSNQLLPACPSVSVDAYIFESNLHFPSDDVFFKVRARMRGAFYNKQARKYTRKLQLQANDRKFDIDLWDHALHQDAVAYCTMSVDDADVCSQCGCKAERLYRGCYGQFLDETCFVQEASRFLSPTRVQERIDATRKHRHRRLYHPIAGEALAGSIANARVRSELVGEMYRRRCKFQVQSSASECQTSSHIPSDTNYIEMQFENKKLIEPNLHPFRKSFILDVAIKEMDTAFRYTYECGGSAHIRHLDIQLHLPRNRQYDDLSQINYMLHDSTDRPGCRFLRYMKSLTKLQRDYHHRHIDMDFLLESALSRERTLGYAATRVGEASNPGPPENQIEVPSPPTEPLEDGDEFNEIPRDCSICAEPLIDVRLTFEFPCCREHIHFDCLVQLYLHRRQAQTIMCPFCRSNDFTVEEFRTMCNDRQIEVDNLQRQNTHNTIRQTGGHSHDRTYAENAIPDPPQPADRRGLCCPQISGYPDFLPLPTRTMHWAPTAVREGDQIDHWLEQWMCRTCHRTVDRQNVNPTSDPYDCRQCLQRCTWVFEGENLDGEWRCTRCDNDWALRRICRSIRPMRVIHDQAAPDINTVITVDTNSFLYCPLLLDVAGMLNEDDSTSWQQHAHTRDWWSDAIRHLRQARRIPAQELFSAFSLVQNGDDATRTIRENSSQNDISLIDCVQALADNRGHIYNQIQDVIFELYGGSEFARQLDRLSNRFRQPPPNTSVGCGHEACRLYGTRTPAIDDNTRCRHCGQIFQLEMISNRRSTEHGRRDDRQDMNTAELNMNVSHANISTHLPPILQGVRSHLAASDLTWDPNAQTVVDQEMDDAEMSNPSDSQAYASVHEGTDHVTVNTSNNNRARGRGRRARGRGQGRGTNRQTPSNDGRDTDDNQTDTVHDDLAGPSRHVSRNTHRIFNGSLNDEIWNQLDAVDLRDEFKIPVTTLQDIPHCIYRDVLRIRTIVNRALVSSYSSTNRTHIQQIRAWKLFCLMSRLLLHKMKRGGSAGSRELRNRIDKFDRGQWTELLVASRNTVQIRRPRSDISDPAAQHTARIENALRLIKQGELSHASRILRSEGVAPGNEDTFRQLNDPQLRPPRLTRPLSHESQTYVPESPVELDGDIFISNLRSARKGLSAGVGGTRNEHLKVCLENEGCLQDLVQIAQLYAQGDVPAEINAALRLCKMTAIRKTMTKIRGLNAGDSFRRLVGRTLAQQFNEEFKTTTAPYNYGMSLKSGMDSLIHSIRALSDERPDLVITKIDGVGAFDHIFRQSMLDGLYQLPNAKKLLPFVRMSYDGTSSFLWTDENGVTHEIEQGEGGEQGDALMPALFCLGLHRALHASRQQMHQDDFLFAYLDDIYLVTVADRARVSYDIVKNELSNHAGIAVNLGKTESWSKSGNPPPPGVNEIDPNSESPIYKGDLASIENGIEILGSPVGSDDYLHAYFENRMMEEMKLLEMIPTLPSLQSAWLLLYFCAAPRANHLLRTVPPSRVLAYTQEHDLAVRTCFANILQINVQDLFSNNVGLQIDLPLKYGGMGLRNNSRISPCAFWASWADSLKTICERTPALVHLLHTRVMQIHADRNVFDASRSIDAFCNAANTLRGEGFQELPSWEDLFCGSIAPQGPENVLDDNHYGTGWQRIASSTRELFARQQLEQVSDRSQCARIRSCSGTNTSRWLTTVPTEHALTMSDPNFRCAILRRINLPVLADATRCEGCNRPIDMHGYHRSTCMRTGRVHARHRTLLETWVRVLREGGASIRIGGRNPHVERLIRNTFLRSSPDDDRRMDIVVSGLSDVMGGTPLFIDVTCVSPLTGNGIARGRSATIDGHTVGEADRRNRNQDYPDIERSSRAKLICAGVETFGRWSTQCLHLIRQLAKSKSASYPEVLQKSIQQAFSQRWWALLSIAVQNSVAENILLDVPADLMPQNNHVNFLPVGEIFCA